MTGTRLKRLFRTTPQPLAGDDRDQAMTDTIQLSTWLIFYAATLFVFLPIDLIWLGLVAKPFYAVQLGRLMAENIRWGVAVGFLRALYCRHSDLRKPAWPARQQPWQSSPLWGVIRLLLLRDL